MKQQTPAAKIVLSVLARFPNATTRTAARIAYKENLGAFSSIEHARGVVRYYRGAQGDKDRKKVVLRKFIRPVMVSQNPFGAIPEGRSLFKDGWGAAQVNGPVTALVLADIHYPFHDRSALMATLEFGRKQEPNLVLLNGDTMDCFSISRWETDPRERDFKGELKATREFLTMLRKGFPKARIIFKLGNHEERYESYMFCKAPEMLGVEDFELRNLLRLKDNDIEEVRDKRPIRLGILNVLHGHEYRFAISNPVNAARGLFLRCKAYAMCGHFHQRSEHSEKNVEQRQIATWSTGCLCQLHQRYAPLNNWVHGFAIVRVEKDGKFHVKNAFVSGGQIF